MKRLESEGAYNWDNNKSNSFKYIWGGAYIRGGLYQGGGGLMIKRIFLFTGRCVYNRGVYKFIIVRAYK